MEFLQWQIYYDLEAEDEFKNRRREDWYQAQTAFWMYLTRHAIQNILAKRPEYPQLRLEDFLIDFRFGDEAKEERPETPEQLLLKTEKSKASWLWAVGLIGRG